MSKDDFEFADEKLSALLQAGRPTPGLPPGFEQQVWRRIEKREQHTDGFLERLARLVLKPRFAAAALATVLILAAGLGALRGTQLGDREARDRYLSSVDPSHSRN